MHRRHGHSSQRNWLKLACAIGLLSASALASAAKPVNYTREEVLSAAPFCPDTMGFDYGINSPNAPKWIGIMGQSFWHMHHYCWARIAVTRSMRAGVTPEKRLALRNEALTDYAYVIRSAEPQFVMLPEVFMRLGEALVLLERFPEAEKAFSQAIDKKPDFWPPYLRWATLVKNQGDRKRAADIAARGLQQAPDAQPLRQLLKELGGKPLPPLPPKAASGESAPADSSAPQAQAAASEPVAGQSAPSTR